MIDSKELRIGNWVSAKVGSGDNWMNETVWGGEYISELEIHPDLGKPIPLSPDILTKAGFQKDGNTYTNDGMYIFFNGTGYYADNDGMEIFIDSLHFLQNWFYFNTKTELTIDL